jgi:predicted patatin/cPLA2 family phospholipase
MATLYDELSAHRLSPKDGRTFGLVLQGGGMRGVYSAGATAPLIQYRFSDTFDHVIGSSAGAIAGAYFMGADAEAMYSYTDDLTNKNFVNLLRREKKVDIDYLVDHVLMHNRPINIKRLLAARSKLHIVMTDAKNGKKVVLSDHHRFAEIYEEFRATAALPLLYDKAVLVDNRWYVDGGVSDLLPVDVAVKLGCTDIVVVMTQKLQNYRFDKRHERLIKHLVKQLARNQPESIRKKLPTDEKILQLNLHRLSHPTKKTRFYVLEPTNEEALISLGTISKPKIETLARLGVTDMDAFLHKPLAL